MKAPFFRGSMLAALLLITGASAWSADTWPDKPITLVVPFPPGGSNDIIARIISRDLAAELGQSIIIDNRGGAGGDLGATYVARQKPDGYTLLITSSTFASNAAISHQQPFDPIKSFSPIGTLARGPLIVTVSNDFPASTPQEMLEQIRKHPGEYNYASSGVGSLNQFSAELLKVQGGDLDITHVPYKGSGTVVGDLIGGRIQVYIASAPVVLPMVASGKVKGIGVTSPTPSPVAPNLPTIASALPGYEYETWWGILAPAGTPAPLVAKINAALQTLIANPSIKHHLLEQGAEPMGGTPENFGSLIATEIQRLRELAARQHISVDE